MVHVSGESKRRLVKVAGAAPCGQRGDQKLHAAMARTHFQVKCTKHLRFGPFFEVPMSKSCTLAVARSTFSSENAQNSAGADHLLKFRYRKIACRCG